MRLVLILSLIFLFPVYASANLIFTEIAYDLPGSDTDREWVEILNDGGSTIDITGYKFNDGANHVLNPPPENGGQGNLSVSSGEYIILSADASTFIFEHPSFGGTVIDTVMSLANTGDTLTLVDADGTTVASVTYTSEDGGAGDGSTLSLIDGDWQSGTSSPGLSGSGFSSNDDDEENNSEDENNNEENNDQEDVSTSSSQKEKPKPKRDELLIDTSGIPKSGTSGNPIIFSATIFGLFDEKISTGRFTWSLGDGEVYESIGNESFYYTYKYPGEYVVTLSYFRKAKDTKIVPDQVARKTIVVTSPSVVIESVGTDGSVVLLNESTEERDIGGWHIFYNGQYFLFPKYTIILPKKRFTIGSHVSGINVLSSGVVSLISSSGDMISSFPKPKEVSKPVFYAKAAYSVESAKSTKEEANFYNDKNINEVPLSANVSKSGNFFGNRGSLLSLFGLILLAIIAVVSVKRLGSKNKNSDPSSDESPFEFVE